ncbi:hypothetical protein [Saccharicrinis sp. GN24d3]|uniref:hypothetical protein n=1 Tax=Saccharicrinis sp. GN24d3 TaxID=3458416 RepID=UPI0040354600
MKKHFIITTDKNTALAIEEHFTSYGRGQDYSFEIGKVTHETGFSDVQIIAKTDAGINPEHIFFLGLYTGMRVERKLMRNDH